MVKSMQKTSLPFFPFRRTAALERSAASEDVRADGNFGPTTNVAQRFDQIAQSFCSSSIISYAPNSD